MHRSRCRWCDRRGKYSRGRGEIIEGRGDWGPVHGDGGGRLDESIATALTRAITSRIRRRSALLSSGEADGRKCRLRRGWQLRLRLRLRLKRIWQLRLRLRKIWQWRLRLRRIWQWRLRLRLRRIWQWRWNPLCT